MNPIKPPHNSPGAPPSSSPEDNASTGGRHVRPVLLLLRPFTALLSAFMYIPGKIGQFVLRSFSPEKRLINRDTPMNQAGDQEKKTDRIMREKISTIVCAKGYSDEQREIIYQALNVITDIDSPEQIDMTLPDRILQHSDPLSAATAVLSLKKTSREKIINYREKILAHSNPVGALAVVKSFINSQSRHQCPNTYLDTTLNLYELETKSSEQNNMLLLDRILQQKDHGNPISLAIAMISLEREDSREVISYREKILVHSDPEEALSTVQDFVKPQEEHGLPNELLDEIIEEARSPHRALQALIHLKEKGLLTDKDKVQMLQHPRPDKILPVMIALKEGSDLPTEFIDCAYNHPETTKDLTKPLISLGAADVEILESALCNDNFPSTAFALKTLVEAKTKGMTIPSDFILFIVKAKAPALPQLRAQLATQLLKLGVTNVEILQLACEKNQYNTTKKILAELIKKETPISPALVCDALNGHGNTQ